MPSCCTNEISEVELTEDGDFIESYSLDLYNRLIFVFQTSTLLQAKISPIKIKLRKLFMNILIL